jgi:hypothetical protein
MVTTEQVIPIMVNEIVKVEFGNSIGKVEDFTKRVDFKKGVSLIDARLTIGATQTDLSGARVSISMNGIELTPELEWHGLENGKKSKTFQVNSLVHDGINKFSVVYTTAFGVLIEQKAVVNVTLDLLLENPKQGEDPIEVGKTTEDDLLTRAGQKVREGAQLILGIGLVFALVTGGGVLLYSKFKS